jgi:GT2 family glycosyltransferase
MNTDNRVTITIIILSYNTRALLERCLSSVFAAQTAKDRWEVIVVDNASTDDSVAVIKNKYPTVSVVENRKNLGFAAGNNVGINKAKGSVILLLNSDTEVTVGAIQETARYLVHQPEAGVATCMLIRPDGSMDPACHRGFPTPGASLAYFLGLEKIFPKSTRFGGYHMGYKDLSQPHQIDSPSGAFFMIKKSVIKKVGLLDERFFMYGEDLDWSYRIKHAGWKIIFYPYTSVLHKKWQSGKAHPDEEQRRVTQQHFYNAMQLFYKKHYQKRYGWLATGFVLLGIKLRSLF